MTIQKVTAKTPWIHHLGDVPAHLDYFQGSMYDAVKQMADSRPNAVAFDFMGKSTTYKHMLESIERCAKSLKTIGIREGDAVTIAMPNCPQAIFMFYAVNMIGGIANMIHPLSSEKEIEFYLNESNSVSVVTLDQFYHKFEAIRHNTNIVNIVIASIKDELSKPVKAGYMLTEGRKVEKIPSDAPVIRWGHFLKLGNSCFWKYKVERSANDPAVILYSGGTTGTTKGIVLTNLNFNALAQQIIATNPMFLSLIHISAPNRAVFQRMVNHFRGNGIPAFAVLVVLHHCKCSGRIPVAFKFVDKLRSVLKYRIITEPRFCMRVHNFGPRILVHLDILFNTLGSDVPNPAIFF